jgi:nitrogen regulatory protein P-II 2
VLVTPEVAHQILQHVSEQYFADFAVVAWSTDVEVLRGEKYGG